MDVSQTHTQVLRGTRLAILSLWRAALESELADYACDFSHKLFSDFRRFISKKFKRIYPAQYLGIINKGTFATAR